MPLKEKELDLKGKATMNEGATYVVQDSQDVTIDQNGWIKIHDDPWILGGGSNGGYLSPNYYQLDILKNFWLSKNDLPGGDILTSLPKVQMRGILKGFTNIDGAGGPAVIKCILEVQQFLVPSGGITSPVNFDVFSAKHMLLELPKNGKNSRYRYFTLPWRNGRPLESFDSSRSLIWDRDYIDLPRNEDLHIAVQARFKVELSGFSEVQLSGYKYRWMNFVSDHIPFGLRIPSWEVFGWA